MGACTCPVLPDESQRVCWNENRTAARFLTVEAGDVDGIARWAFESLASQPDGTILAVWPDGSMTQEGFGFRGRRENGRLIEPVATFPAKTHLSYHGVHKRLHDGFVRRGLLPQPRD